MIVEKIDPFIVFCHCNKLYYVYIQNGEASISQALTVVNYSTIEEKNMLLDELRTIYHATDDCFGDICWEDKKQAIIATENFFFPHLLAKKLSV